jgi:hypothetical protein
MNSDCACVALCVGQMGVPSLDSCVSSCGLDATPTEYGPLGDCLESGCPDSDECYP